MIRFTCPNCETKLKVPDEKAGVKIACPECREKVVVPADDEAEQPRAKAKKGGSGSSGSQKPLLIGVAAAACALVAGGAIWLATGGKSDPKKTDSDTSNNTQTSATPAEGTPSANSGSVIPAGAAPIKSPVLPGVGTPPVASNPPKTEITPANKPADKGSLVKADPQETLVMAGPLAEEVSKRLQKSTAWIVTVMPNSLSFGSGSLVDRQNRLILTNYHVIMSEKKGKLRVFFPEKEKGVVVKEKDWYLKKVSRGEGIPCHVVYHNQKKDLALVQVVDVPEGIQALKISKKSASDGERVHSMGNAGFSGFLWVYTQGAVRGVGQQRWVVKGHGKGDPDLWFDAKVLETQSPTNPGDSGGPVVNDKKELVAVTQGGVTNANLISYSIDVSDVWKVLNECYKENKSLKKPTDFSAPEDENKDLPTLVKVLSDSDPNKRAQTASVLGRYGSEAKMAVPALIKCLKDDVEDVRKSAAEALGQIGNLTQSNLPDLKEALKDKSADVRLAVLGVLKLMGQEAESAVPVLIDVLKDRDNKVRQHAVQTLGQLGGTAKAAVATLGGLLKDESADVRVAAAEALSKMGSDAAPALKAIAEGFKDDNQDVRVYLLETIKNLGPDAKELMPEVMKTLKKERDERTRLAAIGALGGFGPDAKEAVPELVKLLEYKVLRPDLMETLVKIGPAASIPELVKQLGDQRKEIRLAAVQALEKFGGDLKKVVPTLRLRYARELDPDVKKAFEALFRKLQGLK